MKGEMYILYALDHPIINKFNLYLKEASITNEFR